MKKVDPLEQLEEESEDEDEEGRKARVKEVAYDLNRRLRQELATPAVVDFLIKQVWRCHTCDMSVCVCVGRHVCHVYMVKQVCVMCVCGITVNTVSPPNRHVCVCGWGFWGSCVCPPYPSTVNVPVPSWIYLKPLRPQPNGND